MKKHIPNAITLLNLLCGCLAVVTLFSQQMDMTPWFLLAAVVFDYADGMVARILNVHSTLGIHLDSLADMVSFGLVPGAILFRLSCVSLHVQDLPAQEYIRHLDTFGICLTGFLVTVFSAVRLAKFNIDTRQTDNFIGLPVPSSTAFIAGLLLIVYYSPSGSPLPAFVLNPWLLAIVSVVFSYMLVAEVPMINLKFKGTSWKGNEERYLGLIIMIACLVIGKSAGPSACVLCYILYSVGKMVILEFIKKEKAFIKQP